jgi:parvulin-like peptidyl-prolyl isomerase
VLVRVGGEPITRSDVERRLEDVPEQYRPQYSTPEGRQQLLDRMVDEKVWMLAAKKAGVPARPEIQRQIQQQQRDLLIRTYVNEVMAKSPTPTDSATRVYYDAHQAEYRTPATATARHILVKKEADAKKVLSLAVSPKQDWNKLCEKYSVDSLTRKTGGQLGTITKEGVFASIGRQPALAESIFALPEGKIAGPYQTDRGWHVVKVEAVHLESVRPYEQVQPMIQRQMNATSQQGYYQDQLDLAKHKIGVTPDSAAIHGYLSQKKSARDMFKEAQEAGPAATRIELYQKVLDTYPDSDVSPQAQFMIGFIHSEELKDYDGAEAAFKTLLKRYPKSELAASAQWMLEHMRTEEAPSFLNLGADSSQASDGKSTPPKGMNRKP